MAGPALRRGRAARPGRRARLHRDGLRPRRGAARCPRGCRAPAPGGPGQRRGRSHRLLPRSPARPRPPGPESLADGVEELIGADRSAAERQAPVVGLRENEEILGETDKPFGLGCCRANRLLELRLGSRLPEGELELGLEQREGVRSSWLASATKLRSRSIARSSRASISFSVLARRAISSRARPSGSRRPGSDPEIAAASARISSTGRRAAPAIQ